MKQWLPPAETVFLKKGP